MPLAQKISTPNMLAASIVGMVGSGWLLGPLVCANVAGPAAILTWVLAGLMMTVVAATFVQLASKLPTTGGTVRFFQMSYGHFAGFCFSWIAWLAWVAVAPIEAMAALQYVAHYVPGIMTQTASPALTHHGILIAMITMSLISVINNNGVRVYGKVNRIVLAFKLLIPLTTVIVLLSLHMNTGNLTAGGSFLPFGIKSLFAALPFAGVIYCFIGFNPAVQLSAEAQSQRAIPIAIFGAIAVCIVLYTSIQFAFITALPANSITQGWQHVHFTGDVAPFIGLLALFGVVFFIKLLYVDAIVSPLGTGLTQAMATSRMTYAMAENGYFPNAFMKLNANGSPSRAIALNTIVGFIFFMPFPSWQQMVGFLSSGLVLGYVVGPMSLMILADTQPAAFATNKKWQRHGLCLAAFYICNLMIYWSGWHVVSKIATVFVIGYILLFAMMSLSPTTRDRINDLQFKRGAWVIAYMASMTLLSYFGSFGGGQQMVTFGNDFILMAALTSSIYALAWYCAYNTLAPTFELRQAVA